MTNKQPHYPLHACLSLTVVAFPNLKRRCVIIKNEEAYLDEWIDYHRAVGFTHFYIYDNSYHFDLQQWAEEQKDYGRPVTVYHMPGNSKQHSAYHVRTFIRYPSPRSHSFACLTLVAILHGDTGLHGKTPDRRPCRFGRLSGRG